MSTIREIRHQYGLTQQAMSDLLNIPKRTIEEWEAGRRTPPEWLPPMIEHEIERKNDRGEVKMKVWKNGQKVEESYEQICKNLGFDPDVNFVKVTTAGTISFWSGKRVEILELKKSTENNGYKAAKALLNALN